MEPEPRPQRDPADESEDAAHKAEGRRRFTGGEDEGLALLRALQAATPIEPLTDAEKVRLRDLFAQFPEAPPDSAPPARA